MNAKELTALLSLPDERSHIHHFHPYPARFSPLIARRLLADFKPGAYVFDPFAGSGTTLVEARLAGCHAWGNDLNPVATMLCRVKAQPLSPRALDSLQRDLQYLRKFISHALASRTASQSVRLPKGERLFHPHVYWQLQTMVGAIGRLRGEHARDVFLAALSAIVNRVSLRGADSRPNERRERSFGSRLAPTLFFESAERLLRDLGTFSRQATGGSLQVWQEDARMLNGVPDNSVDLIITSPPYGGTYDYASMHELRNLWLGLNWEPFDRLEIGARRRQHEAQALEAFSADIETVFSALRRVSRPAAKVFWVIADGLINQEVYRGDELSRRAAEKHGWSLGAVGAVARPMWSQAENKAYGRKGKQEYIMEFRDS